MSNTICTNIINALDPETGYPLAPYTCGRRAASPSEVCGHEATCAKCFASWERENDHNDYGHDTPVADCPECGTYNPGPAKKRGESATKGTKQTHTSHAACDHPKTPAARAKCRKARKGGDMVHITDILPAVKVTFVTQKAYDALTDKQREQALAVIDGQGISTDIDQALVQSLTLALVERARTKKTTVAKLSKGDVRNVVAIDSL